MSSAKYHDDLNDEAWNAFSDEEYDQVTGKRRSKLNSSRKITSLIDLEKRQDSSAQVDKKQATSKGRTSLITSDKKKR